MSGDHYVIADAQRQRPQDLAQTASHQIPHYRPADATAYGEPVPTVRELVGLQRNGEQPMTCASPAACDGGKIPARTQPLALRASSCYRV